MFVFGSSKTSLMHIVGEASVDFIILDVVRWAVLLVL